jgi:hypothetical protein
MTVLQNIALPQDSIKLRWKEPYVTAAVNQKNLAIMPKGVVTGFNVTPTLVPSVGVLIARDSATPTGLSIANVKETTGGIFNVTLVLNTDITLDLTPQAGQTVFIALDVQYVVGASTTAQVQVVDVAGLSNTDLVLLAKVNVPGIGNVAASHINMGYRDAAGDSAPHETIPHFNLIHNPTFEATAQGWANLGFDSATASTDYAHSGGYSLKLVKAVAASVSIEAGPMAVVPGQSYRVRAWLHSPAGLSGGNGGKLQVGWYDASGAQIGLWTDVETAIAAATLNFVERKNELTAPTLAFTAKLRVLFDLCSGTLYVDDVQFASHTHDEVMKSSVFGGPSVSADSFHTHSAIGITYGGSPNWADGSSIPAGPIEGAIDAIPTALGGSTGAAKVGFLPVTPVDLTATRVDNAINELDDKKASIPLANTFLAANTFTPSAANATAITATAAAGTGSGIRANGGANTNVGGPTPGTSPTPGPGNGGSFVGGTGVGGGDGIQAFARSSNTSRSGVYASGAWTTAANSHAGPGGYFIGGVPGAGNANGGVGVYATGSLGIGTGTGGAGLVAQGAGNQDGVTSYGGSTSGTGTYGQGGAPNGVGVWGTGTGSGAGVRGNGGGTGHGGHFIGGASVGYGVYAVAQQPGWSGVFGDGKGGGPGVTGRGDQGNVGTNVVGPLGGLFLGGPGALNNLSTSQGGMGLLATGGDPQLLPGTSSIAPYYAGKGGDGLQGNGGTGYTGGVGVVGRGGEAFADSGSSGSAGASGAGGFFQGGGGDGSSALTWHDSGHGLYAIGGNGVNGATGGHGAVVGGGSSDFGPPGYGVYIQAGDGVKFADATLTPPSSQAFKNVLNRNNIVKAWASVTTTTTTASIADGFNITGLTWNAGGLRWDINLAQPITGWGAIIVLGNGGHHWFRNYIGSWSIGAQSTINGASVNFASVGSSHFDIIIIGHQ